MVKTKEKKRGVGGNQFYDPNPKSKQHKTPENTTHTTFVNKSEKYAKGKANV